MAGPNLILELLNGPLDGHIISLESETTWGASGNGPLSFPWDKELHDRQARFFPEAGHWWLEGYPARHGTYRINHDERIETKVQLAEGDMLRASGTWLLIRQIE